MTTSAKIVLNSSHLWSIPKNADRSSEAYIQNRYAAFGPRFIVMLGCITLVVMAIIGCYFPKVWDNHFAEVGHWILVTTGSALAVAIIRDIYAGIRASIALNNCKQGSSLMLSELAISGAALVAPLVGGLMLVCPVYCI